MKLFQLNPLLMLGTGTNTLTSHQNQKLLLTTLLPPTPHTSGKENSVPLPKIQWWGQGGYLALSVVAGQWASLHMSTSFMHNIQDIQTTGAEFFWYRLPLLWLFSACEYFSFTICTVLNLSNFQHMHTAFSVPAASQNTLSRLNKNTFMPVLASFVRAEIVQLHPTDLLLLCVC